MGERDFKRRPKHTNHEIEHPSSTQVVSHFIPSSLPLKMEKVVVVVVVCKKKKSKKNIGGSWKFFIQQSHIKGSHTHN